MKKCFIVINLLLFAFSSRAQSFLGLNTSHYDAIANMRYNPAMLAGSKMRFQVNIIGFDVAAGNDYLYLQGKIKDWVNNFDQDVHVGENLNGKPKDINQSLDFQAPSFMMKIGEKNAIGFSLRVREVVSGNDINEEMATSLFNQHFDILEWENFFADDKTSVSAASWGEIGFTYARTVISNDKHSLKVGATMKLLTNGVVAKLDAENVEFHLSADSLVNMGNTQFDLLVNNEVDAFSSDATEDYKFRIKSMGADVGAVYEFNPKGDEDYLLQAGVSVSDIGKLKYDASKYCRSFVGDGLDHPGQLLLDSYGEYKNLDSILDILGTRTIPTGEFKSALPMTMNAYVDVKVFKNFFINVSTQLNLINLKKDNPAANYPTTITVIPRYEAKLGGVFVPINYNKYSGFNMGAGGRIGQFSIGSSDFISSLIKKQFKSIDLFVSVGIGFGEKKNRNSDSE